MENIVINALQYKRHSSGVGVVIRELLGGFLRVTRFPCTVIASKDAPDFAAGHAEFIRSPYRNGQGLRRIWFQSVRLGPRYCGNSVLLTVDSKIPFLIPRSCKVIPIVTDLAVYRMPKAYQPDRVLLWRLQYNMLKRRASHFVAISEHTKADLTELLGVSPARITVIPCAASSRFSRVTDPATLSRVRSKYRLAGPYILFVGNFNPRKNLNGLLTAFDRLKSESTLPHKLVIAGEHGWRFNKSRAMSSVKHAAAVQFIGYVPDDDLPAIYSMADLFVFPTLYEGFGIPILEAQRCGVPVLASNSSAMPEVAGKSAVYADPTDPADIARAMRLVLVDRALRTRLVTLGYENAKRLSWEQSAERLDAVVAQVLAGECAG